MSGEPPGGDSHRRQLEDGVRRMIDDARKEWQLDRLLQTHAPAAMELVYRISEAEPLTEDEAWEFIARRPAGFRPPDWQSFVWSACRDAEADPREEYAWDELITTNTEFIDENPDFVREGESREAAISRLAEDERRDYDRDFHRNKAKQWQRDVAYYIDRYLAPPPPITAEEADQLTLRQWQAVALLCHRRLSPEEAAEQLDVSATTVQRHLEEAAKALGISTKELRRRSLG